MIYFIGIKGTGMASLACMLHDTGKEVMGSDLEKHFFTEMNWLKEILKFYLLIQQISKITIPSLLVMLFQKIFRKLKLPERIKHALVIDTMNISDC